MAKQLRVEVLRLLVSTKDSALKYGNTAVFPLDVCGVSARMTHNHGNAHDAYPDPDASTWFFFFLFMTAMELETWELLFKNPFFFSEWMS